MKKITVILLSVLLLFCFASCGSESGTDTQTDSSQTTKKLDYLSVTESGSDVQTQEGAFPCVTDAMEYTLYQNIFYNDEGKNYEGETMSKTGTFATLYDEFNKVNRYYVWGYYDMTKCCDWQWEIKIEDLSKLPKNGSLVEMTGVFEKSEDALDGYWFTKPSITVKTAYKSIDCDVDMSVMSATLERVQIINLQNFKETFEGKKVAAYGRVVSGNTIQHPYYDGAWQQDMTPVTKVPNVDTEVLVVGTYKNGVITNAEVSEAECY